MKPGITDLGNGEYFILIPILPYTKKNHQRVIQMRRKGKAPYYSVIPSKEYTQYAKDCAPFLKPLQIDYPVNVEAHYYVKVRRRSDLTNYHAALHDILVQYHVLEDDNAWIIVSTDGSRLYCDKEFPRTEVKITRAERTFELPPSRRT